MAAGTSIAEGLGSDGLFGSGGIIGGLFKGISALFAFQQGGIVPSYAVIVRELFPAQEAGFRVSLAISTTLAGMALGGWLAGATLGRN